MTQREQSPDEVDLGDLCIMESYFLNDRIIESELKKEL